MAKPDWNEWQGADYPVIEPGNYQAVFTKWHGPQWVFSFRRWSLRLEFSLLSEGIIVSAFFNMGGNDQPHIGRRSRFFQVWCMANGDMPRKGQRMCFETFAEPGLIYWVRVDYALKDAQNEQKPDAMVYSRVTHVLKVDRP